MQSLLYQTNFKVLDLTFAVLGNDVVLDGNCIQGMYIGMIRKKNNSRR